MEVPTEQLATKEEIFELEKRLLVLEREIASIKYWTEKVSECAKDIKDGNSTSSYIAGV